MGSFHQSQICLNGVGKGCSSTKPWPGCYMGVVCAYTLKAPLRLQSSSQRRPSSSLVPARQLGASPLLRTSTFWEGVRSIHQKNKLIAFCNSLSGDTSPSPSSPFCGLDSCYSQEVPSQICHTVFSSRSQLIRV